MVAAAIAIHFARERVPRRLVGQGGRPLGALSVSIFECSHKARKEYDPPYGVATQVTQHAPLRRFTIPDACGVGQVSLLLPEQQCARKERCPVDPRAGSSELTQGIGVSTPNWTARALRNRQTPNMLARPGVVVAASLMLTTTVVLWASIRAAILIPIRCPRRGFRKTS